MCCDKLQKIFGKSDCFSKGTSTPIEKGKSFKFEIKRGVEKDFCRIKVDNCLIKDENTQKCDYAFFRCKTEDYYFVELKGGDINTAYKQLKNTIYFFKEKIKLENEKIIGIMVTSGLPASANQKFLKMKEEFIKQKIGNSLQKFTNQGIININE
jgi:hypothetical protein